MPDPAGEGFDANEGDALPEGGSSAKPPKGPPAIDAEALFADGPLRAVPLFPLPNVVLMPAALLPLHIFEQRYRAMTADALGIEDASEPDVSDDPRGDGRGLICMALIRPGENAMAERPGVFATACVGRIVDQHRLPDGRYNLLLQGVARVRIAREHPVGDPHARPDARPYRRADLERVVEKKAFEIDLTEARAKMGQICHRPPLAGTPVGRQLEKVFAGATPTASLADVLAFDLLEEVGAKQALLEETDVRRRVDLLGALLDAQFPAPDSVKSLEERFAADDEA